MSFRNSTCPYNDLPDYSYWRRAVAGQVHDGIDPVIEPGIEIDKQSRVATAGSCFAQHISRYLETSGFNFFVSEPGFPGASRAVNRMHNYGVFSARYGNIYTTRQLLQLFQRAFDDAEPAESLWACESGFLDPFRPAVQPKGFSSRLEAERDIERHLEAVRRLFRELDLFVFTLGLTESWVCKADGYVLPVAPGCAGGEFDPGRYEFRNFSVTEVIGDLREFLRRLKIVNPGAQVLFTVSPVPLIATFESRHVLVSTVHSKSVLRVAAGEVANEHDFVEYFPSYEIVTTHAHGGRFFSSDQREIRPEGVEYVMGIFAKHYLSGEGSTGDVPLPSLIERVYSTADTEQSAPPDSKVTDQREAEEQNIADVICEELFMDAPRS